MFFSYKDYEILRCDILKSIRRLKRHQQQLSVLHIAQYNADDEDTDGGVQPVILPQYSLSVNHR